MNTNISSEVVRELVKSGWLLPRHTDDVVKVLNNFTISIQTQNDIWQELVSKFFLDRFNKNPSDDPEYFKQWEERLKNNLRMQMDDHSTAVWCRVVYTFIMSGKLQ